MTIMIFSLVHFDCILLCCHFGLRHNIYFAFLVVPSVTRCSASMLYVRWLVLAFFSQFLSSCLFFFFWCTYIEASFGVFIISKRNSYESSTNHNSFSEHEVFDGSATDAWQPNRYWSGQSKNFSFEGLEICIRNLLSTIQREIIKIF